MTVGQRVKITVAPNRPEAIGATGTVERPADTDDGMFMVRLDQPLPNWPMTLVPLYEDEVEVIDQPQEAAA